MICIFALVKSWDINKSSRFIVLAFATALLMSLIRYPLRVKFLIRVCDALSNKLSSFKIVLGTLIILCHIHTTASTERSGFRSLQTIIRALDKREYLVIIRDIFC